MFANKRDPITRYLNVVSLNSKGSETSWYCIEDSPSVQFTRYSDIRNIQGCLTVGIIFSECGKKGLTFVNLSMFFIWRSFIEKNLDFWTNLWKKGIMESSKTKKKSRYVYITFIYIFYHIWTQKWLKIDFMKINIWPCLEGAFS